MVEDWKIERDRFLPFGGREGCIRRHDQGEAVVETVDHSPAEIGREVGEGCPRGLLAMPDEADGGPALFDRLIDFVDARL